jgi:hypothetical protein
VSSSVVESPVADTVNKLISDEEQVSCAGSRAAQTHRRGQRAPRRWRQSNWQIAEPQAVWMSHGLGSKVYDVDVIEAQDGSAVCSALDTRLGAAVEDGAEPGEAAIVIRPERITVQGVDEPVGHGHNAIGGVVAQVVHLGHCTQVHVDVGAPTALIVEVPNHCGPGSVSHQPGERVNCVRTHDAVRVLHRNSAPVIADPVAEDLGAREERNDSGALSVS